MPVTLTYKQREELIHNYISAYNSFDIEEMFKDADEAIQFKNITAGEVNMSLNGLPAFKAQAEQAKSFFSSRQQTITAILHKEENTEIAVNYHAILAVDLPNGLKQGDALNLTGRSVFTFAGDKIIGVTDLS